ncbi:MAG: AraC family transcriptional regulator [Verrucomicrobia bacterium]|nr:AraC family transcriptional regulator [Verrucomicrobiota bacterium]
MPKKTTEHTLPSEIALVHTWANLERPYTDCRHYWLDEAERLRWHHAPSPVLAGFQVFSCGRFVEAWGHMWERDKLPEGVLIYCVDGKGYYQADDRDWLIGAGDLLYAPPNTHHLYWADGRHPWSKQVTGNSPAAWFIQRKIQRACALLTIPNIRVKEVATRLSYEDPLYFSKVFKRVVGMSPEDYRQKLVENQHLFGSRR